METEILSPDEETDGLNDFVAKLQELAGGSKSVQLATVATNGGAEAEIANKGALSMKPTEPTEELEKKDPLRKNFEVVAAFHPDFRHFASTKALEDPVGYLRDTYVDNKGKRQFKVSNSELEMAMQIALAAGATKQGTAFGEWMSRGGQAGSIQQAFAEGLNKGAFSTPDLELLRKTLDSGAGSGGPLIRTDIDPMLREAYLRKFPMGDKIRRFPANGLVHSYMQRTAVGTAATISELGSLSATASDSTYQRAASSHIAVIAAQRQISLKLQYAVAQAGYSNFNLSGAGNLEVMGAMTAIARLNQSLICQGNFSIAAKTLDDEEGLTDANSYDGLRLLLKGAGTSITKDPAESFLRTLNRAVAQVINSGGDTDDLTILCSLGSKIEIEDELMNFLRVLGATPGGFPTNLASNGIITVADTVSKLMAVPAASQGEGMGYYTFGGNVVEDIDVIDNTGIGLAYLGSPTPSVLELPIGYNNALSNVYIPFLMNGLVMFITSFHRKIRVPKVAV